MTADKSEEQDEGNVMEEEGDVNSWFTYLQAFLMVFAIQIGAGILAYPVVLFESGLGPGILCLIVTTITLMANSLFLIELMQKSQTIAAAESCGEEASLLHKDNTPPPIDLFIIARIFLPFGFHYVFIVIYFFSTFTYLVSFSLAGSEAIAVLFSIDHIMLIPFFFWIMVALLILTSNGARLYAAGAAMVKGTLLLLSVITVIVISSHFKTVIVDDYSKFARPFLVSIACLGGHYLTLPLTYNLLVPSARAIRKYSIAVCSAYIVVSTVVILFAYAVLNIVPQSCPDISANNCFKANTIWEAFIQGEIATVPLTQVVSDAIPELHWLIIVLQLFIAISVKTAFLITGLSVVNTSAGITKAITNHISKRSPDSKWVDIISPGECCPSPIYVACLIVYFTGAFIVTMYNPNGFVSILEYFSSTTAAFIMIGIFIMGIIAHLKYSETELVLEFFPGWTKFVVGIICTTYLTVSVPVAFLVKYDKDVVDFYKN